MRIQKSLWLAAGLVLGSLGLLACQAAPSEAEATSVSIPTLTASPVPPTATFTPSPTPTIASPTPTATLAPFPEEALSGSQKPSLVKNLRTDLDLAPIAYSPYEHFYFSHPVPLDYLGQRVPSSRYGNDQHAENGAGHTGLDHGTPILAAAEGEVIFSGYGLLTKFDNPEDPYGLAIVIQHDFGYDERPLYTVYAHLSQNLVEVGEHVDRGEEIARSGDTGFSSGPHIHFEVRIDENGHDHSRNPELWIRPPEGRGVLVGHVLNTLGNPIPGQSIKITNLDSGRHYWAYSYLTTHNITADNYFGENFVFSDLPAGNYQVAVYYYTGAITQQLRIEAGQISYFTFSGTKGFETSWPETETPPNIPQ